jgi:RNA polymerase sigma-70 factor (ECF subfamily)
MGGPLMTDEADTNSELLRRIKEGDERALVELFARHRDRLKRMVRIRLDRRLQGRVDPSDIIQEAHIEVHRRAGEYVRDRSMPAFLWFRFLTGERLLHAHRRHLGTQMRDAGQEISLHQGAFPQATSMSLAALLLGRLTSPTLAAQRAEMQLRLQTILNQMDPIDREVLTLRHFEELSNSETARVLGLEKTAASNRYIRALRRLRDVLATMPGFFEP